MCVAYPSSPLQAPPNRLIYPRIYSNGFSGAYKKGLKLPKFPSHSEYFNDKVNAYQAVNYYQPKDFDVGFDPTKFSSVEPYPVVNYQPKVSNIGFDPTKSSRDPEQLEEKFKPFPAVNSNAEQFENNIEALKVVNYQPKAADIGFHATNFAGTNEQSQFVGENFPDVNDLKPQNHVTLDLRPENIDLRPNKLRNHDHHDNSLSDVQDHASYSNMDPGSDPILFDLLHIDDTQLGNLPAPEEDNSKNDETKSPDGNGVSYADVEPVNQWLKDAGVPVKFGTVTHFGDPATQTYVFSILLDAGKVCIVKEGSVVGTY